MRGEAPEADNGTRRGSVVKDATVDALFRQTQEAMEELQEALSELHKRYAAKVNG